MSGCWEKFVVVVVVVVAQQNRVTPSPFNFGLWTWTMDLDCDKNISIFLTNNADCCTDVLRRMSRGLAKIFTFIQNIDMCHHQLPVLQVIDHCKKSLLNISGSSPMLQHWSRSLWVMFCILVSRVCLYYCLCRLASLPVSLSLDVRKQIKHKNVKSMLPAVGNVRGVSDNIELKLGSKWGF